jgi:pimeloyl-ACP methyl ester carboxylesterase
VYETERAHRVPQQIHSAFVDVGGVRTHYLDCGDWSLPHVLLLHSGEFGGSAWTSWEANLLALAQRFHVVAPDLIGYGRTDKIRDFAGHSRRLVRHVADFCRALCIDEAHFVGSSMSARLLCKVAADRPKMWPIVRMVCAGGGGAEPMNDARAKLFDYDGTAESMREMLSVLFTDDRLLTPEYVDRRIQDSHARGAWEVNAAGRFQAPFAPQRPLFKTEDSTAYEQIDIPVLLACGTKDPLLPPRYWEVLSARIPDAQVQLFDESGHFPNIEEPERFNNAVLSFLGSAEQLKAG